MIYLDYAATTPLRKEVFEEMIKYFRKIFANPASLHSFGQEALRAVDESRERIRGVIGASYLREIIFTSSSTEANNLAIKGLVFFYYFKKGLKPHIITSTIEHSSILDPLTDLEDLGIIEVSYLKPENDGLLKPEKVLENIKENTILITLHYVNSELGNKQPVKEIGKKLSDFNNNRKQKVYFHVDAAQAILTENLNVQELNIDLMTLSSHKIYGPKGISCLYIKLGTPLIRLISGSGHEFDLRGGTEAVPLVVGFSRALELTELEKIDNINHFLSLRNYFLQRLKEEQVNFEVNTNLDASSPKILNLYFPSKLAQDIFLYLDLNEVYISSGTACKSRSIEPSYMVTEVFRDRERAKRSLRFSFGKETTREELDRVVLLLREFLLK